MRRRVDQDIAGLMLMPSDSRKGETLAAQAVGGKWPVTDNAGNSEIALGAVSKIAGTLVVHGINSWNNNITRLDANKVWTSLELAAGVPFGFEFDEIDITASTAGLFAAGNMLVLL